MAEVLRKCVADVKRCAELLGHAGDDANTAEQFGAAVTKLRAACAELQLCDSSSSAQDSGNIWGSICAVWVSIHVEQQQSLA